MRYLAGELGQAFGVGVAVVEQHVDGVRSKRFVLDLVNDQVPLAFNATVSPGLYVRLFHRDVLGAVRTNRRRQDRQAYCQGNQGHPYHYYQFLHFLCPLQAYCCV